MKLCLCSCSVCICVCVWHTPSSQSHTYEPPSKPWIKKSHPEASSTVSYNIIIWLLLYNMSDINSCYFQRLLYSQINKPNYNLCTVENIKQALNQLLQIYLYQTVDHVSMYWTAWEGELHIANNTRTRGHTRTAEQRGEKSQWLSTVDNMGTLEDTLSAEEWGTRVYLNTGGQDINRIINFPSHLRHCSSDSNLKFKSWKTAVG